MLQNYKQFIGEIFKRLNELGIDTSQLKIDHIGYQASSAQDYDLQVKELSESAVLVSEHIVDGRRVGIFTLVESLDYENEKFSVVEIIEPKKDQEVKSALEHIEFLVGSNLEDFMAKYPEIDFDTRAMNREEFPMLILSLGDGLRAKFPRRGVLEEVYRQHKDN